MKISPEKFREVILPILERGGFVMAGRYAGSKVDVRTSRDSTTGLSHTCKVIHHVIKPGSGTRRDIVQITEWMDPAKADQESVAPWTKGRFYLFEFARLTNDGEQIRAEFANKVMIALEGTGEGGSAAEPRPAL